MDFLDFLDTAIFTPILKYMDMLDSDAISDYFFGGSVSLLGVLVTFFVGWVVLRFILAPVRLRYSDSRPLSHISSSPSSSSQEISTFDSNEFFEIALRASQKDMM